MAAYSLMALFYGDFGDDLHAVSVAKFVATELA